ncbi:serine/threonine-protein kinase [Nocardioides sp. 616]|uniref:serine/threonine-protein kinase n=1 Tax=Nocardioides sp. 616 TaxID=2268090 RepID=UPI0013B3C5BF|nr:serine/threonine-protein kinase [Nocardioides sp. 616]
MTTSPSHPTPPSEVRVGGYRLLARLGEGGMGVVHLAQRPGGRRVALKVMRPHVVGAHEARERLAREVASLSRIRSPRVAEIVDADPWGEIPYVATRYVPGLSLHDAVQQEGPITGIDLDWFARCLVEALGDVHGAGVLHRDVKPSNVLMEGRAPVLIDFGLARVADDPRLTQTGWLIGTPGYLAPEILHGEDASAASDIHSLAATIAFAGTGRAPFGRGPAMAIMDRVRRGEHDLSGLPARLREVVQAALDPEPERRPVLGEVLDWLEGRRPAGPWDPVDDLFTAPLVAAAWPEAAPEPTPATGEPTARFETPTLVDLSRAGLYDDRAYDDRAYAADRREGDEPVEDLLPWDQTPEVAEHTGLGERARRLTLLAGLGAAAAGASAAAPYVTLAVTMLVVWLLRSGSLAASAAGERRRLRGRRWYDGVQLTLAAPWHLAASIPGTLLLGLWAAGVGAAAALLCFAVALSTGTSLGVIGGAFALGLWLGPGGGRVRRPVRRVVAPLAATPVVWLVAAAVVLATASGFWALAGQHEVSWAPWSGAPWQEISLSDLL